MAGTFYGIGVGPGDPELLTMKAIKAIEKADVLIAPKTEKKDGSVALKGVGEYTAAAICSFAYGNRCVSSALSFRWQRVMSIRHCRQYTSLLRLCAEFWYVLPRKSTNDPIVPAQMHKSKQTK